MSLTDVPQREMTVADVANDIRGHLASVISLADVRLLQIRNLVRDNGQAAIATELGTDGPALLTVYTKLKEAIEAAKEVTIEDLP